MKICTNCQTENEQENKFCKSCRTPLFINEVASAEGDETDKHKKMMCPNCRMVYEKEERCVKCKGKLVPKDSLDQKVEDKTDDGVEERLSPPVHVPPVRQKEPASPPPERNTLRTDIPPDIRKESSPSPTPTGAAKRPLEDTLSILRLRKRDSILSPSNLAVACVIVVIGLLGYQWTRGPRLGASTSGDSPLSVSTASSSAAPLSQGEEREIEGIKALLENIRMANLQKDINLFMSCYAVDFKDRENRKRSTLESWKNFHYLDLSYNVKHQILSGDTATIEVEWWTKTSRDKDGQPEENRATVNASLKKEEGNSRIKEARTVS